MSKYSLLFLLVLMLSGCVKKDNHQEINLDEYTIEMLQSAYAEGILKVSDVVEYYINSINNIDKSGPNLNSIIKINPDALSIAKNLDKKNLTAEEMGPIYGIPIILKDNIDTNDKMPTTAGSRILRNSFPIKDSWVAKKIRDAGGIILGKANLSEWANYRSSVSSSGWSGINGQTKNPYILDRNPCGSSSGSAVAVSSNLCLLAIGTETWGSIMCPSNANGIVGIKPTVGLWSRSGIIPISYTQDTAGPMARTVTDAAKLLGVLTGVDSSDSKTIFSSGKSHTDYSQFLNIDGLNNKKIGFLNNQEGINERVDSLMLQAIKQLKQQGATIIEFDKIVDKDAYKYSLKVMAYEFKDGINKYLKRLGNNRPVSDLQSIIDSTYLDSIEMEYFDLKLLEESQKKGTLENKDYKEALSNMLNSFRDNGIDRIMDQYNLDAIISPTGGPAWITDFINGDKVGISSSIYAALSGYPNITVPMGFIDDLPVGISFFGRAWSEPILIEIAYSYEQSTKHRKKPEFLNPDDDLILKKSFYSNGNEKYQRYYKDGKAHGKWLYRFSNGQLWIEGEYNNGIQVGLWTTYYDNGQCNTIGHYKEDQRYGKWVFYNRDGSMYEEKKY